jgi:hypothetical protein
LPLEAATLLSEGRVAEAIKVVRETDGVGAEEARNRVNAHIAREPMLGVQLATQRRATRRKIFFWFLVVDLAATAGAIYWFVYRGPA